MPKRKKAQEEEVFHVEVITKARVSDDGEWEYFVKWAGYDSDSDSWEPTVNVQRCERLLESFWKHVGTDDDDYPIGYEIAARKDWIDREKRYFQDTFVKPAKRKSNNATKKTRQEKQKSKSSTSHESESTADDSQSSYEEPSPPAKGVDRMTRIVDTESESESDSSLRKQVKAVSRLKVTTPPLKETPRAGPASSHSVYANTSSAQAKRQELPSTIGVSTSIAPPKITAVRTHQDQRTNPLVKSISLLSKSVEAGSSLSTKQRIAAGILPPPTGPKPLPPVPKKALPPLSFKKIKTVIPPSNPTKDMIATSSPVAMLTLPVVQTADVNDLSVAAPSLVSSPQPMDVDQPIDPWGSILEEAIPMGRSPDIPTFPIPSKSQEEINAEEFLQTINIPMLSGPLEIDVALEEPVHPMTELTKALTLSKIPKKWRWSGDLFIGTSKSKAELLCGVTVADPGGTSNTSHINLLLSLLDSLQISKLYPIMDLSPLLRACGKPQYFGILQSNDSSEEVIIQGLEHYLTSEGLAAAIPLLLDATEVAVLIIFPGAQQGLTKVLQVPDCLLSGMPLIVVLLPFTVSAMTSTNAAGWRSIETVEQSSSDQLNVLVSYEPQEALLYQAMTLLCFPKALLDFFNSPLSRTYCILPSPDQMPPGLDTAMLQYILKSTKALLAKPEEDVRVVFISREHLRLLHTMPSLVTKLVNCPETQFWTYGYSGHQSWRVQEIYPLGGIITFTSSALTEDLIGCHQLMSQIIEHPLWDCYLIPEVLAVSHLLCIDEGPDSSGASYLTPILDFINLGLISVLRMPKKGYSNQVEWLSQVFDQSCATGDELLEAYLRILRNHPITLGMKAEQLITFTNGEISKDLSNAQVQPAFMENYRRFVVIRATSEDTTIFDKDGLEWSPLSLFSFKDDYFQL